MLRRDRGRHQRPKLQAQVSHQGAPPHRRQDSSRLSRLVMDNPVNQVADWSHDTYLLEDLVERFPLPQIVRCADRLVPGEESHLPVNVHVPMLLFSGRSARKLLAKHVAPAPKGQGQTRLAETDESIVIPVDYDGHFLRLQARTTNDRSVVRSLQYIAQNPIPAFVNFTPVISFTSAAPHPAYGRTQSSSSSGGGFSGQVISNGDSHSQAGSGASSKASSKKSSGKSKPHGAAQMKLLHPPGSVFVVTGTSRGLANHKKKSRDVVLVKCTDENGQEVLIPSDQPGEFIEAETPTNGSTKLSVQPRDLLAANRYPGLVRYVYGNHAPRLTPCSLMFMLVDTFAEDSVIGCLLYPDHAMMIEMPLMSSLSFQVALNRDILMTLPLPRHAIGVVQSRRETFVRDLKLKVKFLHRVNASLSAKQAEIADEDLPSATVRTRQYVDEAFFYL